MTRLILHSCIFAFALMNISTISIVPFLLPIFVMTIISAKRNFGTEFGVTDMFWLMISFFFIVDPAKTFSEPLGSSFFSGGVTASYGIRGELTYARQSLIIMFVCMYLATFAALMFLSPKRENIDRKYLVAIDPSLVTLGLISLFLLDVILRGGVENVLSARYMRDASAESMAAIFSRSAFMALVFFSITPDRKNPHTIFNIVVAITLSAIMFNPFNASRFSLLQMWLPIFLVLIPAIRSYNYLAVSLLLGAAFLMPILSYTTRFGFGDNVYASYTGDSLLDFLDITRCFIHLIDMVTREGYAYGLSILSVLLFFVPRSIWPEKPSVVALYVGQELLGWGIVGTDNLSGPIISDLYLDFGVIGVLIGSLAVSFLFRLFINLRHTINGISIFSYIVMSQLPILMRGAVGAVIPLAAFSLFFYFAILLIFAKQSTEDN